MNMNLNEQIVSVVGQKRSRDKINQKYLWHHRLDHIGEDMINKPKKDGILGSLNPESYPVCESCFQEKMAKLPFIGHGERATSYLPWYTPTCVGHLMCRPGMVIPTSLPLPMIYLSTSMCIS